MTLEMKIQEEREAAKAEGIAEGREVGKTEVIKNMLSQSFDHELIAKLCDCDIAYIEQIASPQ